MVSTWRVYLRHEVSYQASESKLVTGSDTFQFESITLELWKVIVLDSLNQVHQIHSLIAISLRPVPKFNNLLFELLILKTSSLHFQY